MWDRKTVSHSVRGTGKQCAALGAGQENSVPPCETASGTGSKYSENNAMEMMIACDFHAKFVCVPVAQNQMNYESDWSNPNTKPNNANLVTVAEWDLVNKSQNSH